jgi:hypothetical protein
MPRSHIKSKRSLCCLARRAPSLATAARGASRFATEEARRTGVPATPAAAASDQKLRMVAAYGNATTDICAYAEAGISAAVTYIAGKHAGEACGDGEPTQPIANYRDHAETLELEPASRSLRRSPAP